MLSAKKKLTFEETCFIDKYVQIWVFSDKKYLWYNDKKTISVPSILFRFTFIGYCISWFGSKENKSVSKRVYINDVCCFMCVCVFHAFQKITIYKSVSRQWVLSLTLILLSLLNEYNQQKNMLRTFKTRIIKKGIYHK